MEQALSKDLHLTLNRHLNNYQRALMLEQLDPEKMILNYLQSKDQPYQPVTKPILVALTRFDQDREAAEGKV